MEASGVLALGFVIEQMTDKITRRVIFLLMAAYSIWIMVYEIIFFQNPIKYNNTYGLSDLGIQPAVLITMKKTLQLVHIIAMAKWFSRNWFPFFVSIWLLSRNIPGFIKKYFVCEQKFDQESEDYIK